MTDYATHRFSVGQQVVRLGESRSLEVVAQIVGSEGPQYRVRYGSSETVVGERELAYQTGPGPRGGARQAFVLH
jgi:hypothetical protein